MTRSPSLITESLAPHRVTVMRTTITALWICTEKKIRNARSIDGVCKEIVLLSLPLDGIAYLVGLFRHVRSRNLVTGRPSLFRHDLTHSPSNLHAANKNTYFTISYLRNSLIPRWVTNAFCVKPRALTCACTTIQKWSKLYFFSLIFRWNFVLWTRGRRFRHVRTSRDSDVID